MEQFVASRSTNGGIPLGVFYYDCARYIGVSTLWITNAMDQPTRLTVVRRDS